MGDPTNNSSLLDDDILFDDIPELEEDDIDLGESDEDMFGDMDDSDFGDEEDNEESEESEKTDGDSGDTGISFDLDEESEEESDKAGEESENSADGELNFDLDDESAFDGFEDIIKTDDEETKTKSEEIKTDTKKTLSEISIEDIANLNSDEVEALLIEGGIESEELESQNNEYEHIVSSEKSDGFEIESVEDIEQPDSIDADHDGTILKNDALLTDNFDTVDKDADFISDTGEIVVMDDSEGPKSGENFKLQYIDIEKIAVVKRIRKNTTNVEDLAQSIKSTGLLEPLVVAPTATEGLYVLLAGFRRIMACARVGKRRIPCIVNIKANVPDIPVLEALYNHSKSYTIREIVDYIEYLEKQKGVMSASMIEYLLQLNSGDYTKLKDILNDNDDDIVTKLFDGVYTIEMAFKKLEQRRKKESTEEKDNKKAAKVYEDEAESGATAIAGSGEETDEGEALSEDEIKSLSFSANELDDADNEDLQELVSEGDNIEGFQPHKQDYKDRERLDPALRKAVLARDENTCQICKINSGQEFTEVLDVHHIVEVYLGGDDNIDNLITACTVCHKLIHLYGRGELHIRPIEELSPQEQERFKRISKLGNVIRKGMAAKGMKREQLKKVDNADTIGRTKPGTGQKAT